MLDKDKGMAWLRETGNGGLIIPTVNAGTLSSFAKGETLAGHPLPSDIFKIGTAQAYFYHQKAESIVKNDDSL